FCSYQVAQASRRVSSSGLSRTAWYNSSGGSARTVTISPRGLRVGVIRVRDRTAWGKRRSKGASRAKKRGTNHRVTEDTEKTTEQRSAMDGSALFSCLRSVISVTLWLVTLLFALNPSFVHPRRRPGRRSRSAYTTRTSACAHGTPAGRGRSCGGRT